MAAVKNIPPPTPEMEEPCHFSSLEARDAAAQAWMTDRQVPLWTARKFDALREYRKEVIKSAPETHELREGFVNKRDAPFGLGNVLSQFCGPQWADLPMPVVRDWSTAPGRAGVHWASKTAAVTPPIEHRPWDQRPLSKLVWRGGLTGQGVTVCTNVRMQLVSGSKNDPDFDCKATSYNVRTKLCHAGSTELERIHIPMCGVVASRENFMSLREQQDYQFTIVVDGNVGADRVGTMLGAGFCVLIQRSCLPQCELMQLLVPGKHYIAVSNDLSDLEGVLAELRDRPAFAQGIAREGRAFWEANLSTEAMAARCLTSLRALPPPSTAVFDATFSNIVHGTAPLPTARSAIYILCDMTAGRLLAFCPFVNEQYTNTWHRDIVVAPGSSRMAIFNERGVLPPKQWWLNQSLVCNVAAPGHWGDAMCPQIMDMLKTSLACAS